MENNGNRLLDEELLQKIISKAYEVNEKTNHSIFINFAGFFKSIELLVYIDGWKGNAHSDIQKLAHLDSKEGIKELEDILQELEILERG